MMDFKTLSDVVAYIKKIFCISDFSYVDFFELSNYPYGDKYEFYIDYDNEGAKFEDEWENSTKFSISIYIGEEEIAYFDVTLPKDSDSLYKGLESVYKNKI